MVQWWCFIYHNLLFRLEIFLSGTKMSKFFLQKFNSMKNWRTWKKVNNFTLLCSLHLPLSTTFCLHVSLERNIDHEFRAWNKKPSKNFRHEIFSSENMTTIFCTNYFGVEINANENKQITVLCIQSISSNTNQAKVTSWMCFLAMLKPTILKVHWQSLSGKLTTYTLSIMSFSSNRTSSNVYSRTISWENNIYTCITS